MVSEIAAAVAQYGRNRFLFVRRNAPGEAPFTIYRVRAGFCIATIDRFAGDSSTLTANPNGWEQVCRKALTANWHDEPLSDRAY